MNGHSRTLEERGIDSVASGAATLSICSPQEGGESPFIARRVGRGGAGGA